MARVGGVKLLALISLAFAPACASAARVPRSTGSLPSGHGSARGDDGPRRQGELPPQIPQRAESVELALARAQESAREMPWDDAEVLVRLAELEMDRGSL